MDEVKRIPVAGGLFALVDAADYGALAQHSWHLSSGKYVAWTWQIPGTRSGRTFLMHREILKAPPGLDVDHVNHDKLDNRRSNIRIATHSQNCCHQKISRVNRCGFKGVTIVPPRERSSIGGWKARIQVDGIQRYLGFFATPEEAARAYDAAAVKLHGEFALLNFAR